MKLLYILLTVLGLTACTAGQMPADNDAQPPQVEILAPEGASPSGEATRDEPASTLKITAGEHTFMATFADNSSAEAFQALLEQGPVTVEMADYGGFEKVGPLGTELPRNDRQITTEPGDIILDQGDQITIYYGTNTWNFTRLARIDDPADLQDKLGEGAISVTFSLEQEE